ncbi:MAG: preprotein translocase subunit SecE [Dehalococcoidales bacterium]|jgi:preprotein translocase subunit SecE
MKQQATATKKITKRFKLISETINELRKVVWLTRRETVYLTTLVIIVAASTGVVLGVLDFGFTHLVSGFFLGR